VADLQSHYHDTITDTLKCKPYVMDGEYILPVPRVRTRAHTHTHMRAQSFDIIKATLQQHKHSQQWANTVW
jgi:hypothetical protein